MEHCESQIEASVLVDQCRLAWDGDDQMMIK
jgi:hypothetical protein